MEKEFILYEQALALKELGFNEPCIGYATIEYKDVVHCGISFKIHKETDLPTKPFGVPLYQQVFRWFRDKYNLHAEPYTADMGAIEYCFQIRDLYSEKYIYDNFRGAGNSYMGTFHTPEEAELECLKKLIEIVKTKK
jgi:hypothetical protein